MLFGHLLFLFTSVSNDGHVTLKIVRKWVNRENVRKWKIVINFKSDLTI